MLIHGCLGSSDATWANGLYWLNAVTSLLWLGVAWGMPVAGRLKRWALFGFGLIMLAEWFMVLNFRTRLSSGYLFLLFSNVSDWDDFALSYYRTLLPLLGFGLLFWTACWFGMGLAGKPDRKVRVPVFLLALTGLLTAYGSVFVRGVICNGWHRSGMLLSAWDIANKEMGAPMGVFFQSAVVLKTHSETEQYVALRRGQTVRAKQSIHTPGEIYVLVIGESSRSQNWGLLGYSRNTNPNLSALPNLVGFPQVLSTACVTAHAVPGMLSFQQLDEWKGVLSGKSVISAFRSAGFLTYWLSTQEMDIWAGGCIPVVAEEAGNRRFFDRNRDGILIEEVRKLSRSTAGRPTLLVLHTKGSHFRFDRRYPREFAIHPTGGVNTRTSLVNAYDNSILYTDWVLANIANVLERSGRPSVMAYMSDHGENLYDDSNEHFGHGIGTRYDLASACFFWCSKSFARAKPAKLGAMISNARKRVSASSLAHTLAGLADLKTDGYRESFDVSSFSFEQRPRWYLFHGEPRIEGPTAD